MVDNVDNLTELNSENLTSPESTQERVSNESAPSEAQVLTELDKLEKFKYQGQEWTAKDLEKAILRQKDYTQKTQALSKDRGSFDSTKKYYENLPFDLMHVKNNPHLASKFLEMYPKEFHPYLKDYLSHNGNQDQSQASKPQQTFDVDTMSRLTSVEKTLHEQDVLKHTQTLERDVEKYTKEFPNALPEMAIGRVFEAINKGSEYSDKLVQDAFKQVDAQITSLVKQKYGDLVKKQTEANKKSRDVDSGGGTVGRAPQKFKNLGEVTNYAVKSLTGKG